MNQLSEGSRIYVLGTIFAGALLYAWWLPQLWLETPLLLVLAAGLASLLQVLSVFGSTARSSYSLSWIVYGFTLVTMGAPAVLVVILVAHVAEWIAAPERLQWYVQLFNVGNFAVASSLAAAFCAVQPGVAGESQTWLLQALVGLAAFTVTNHLMVGWVIRLARGQSLTESGVFGGFTLVLDYALLCLGLLATIVWEVNPTALLLVGLIGYLLYEALKIPALERKAETDSKTQLFNASYFQRSLEEELARAIRYDRPLTVVMGDLDLLRNINNTHGHLAGDVVLKGVARKMLEAAGEYEVVARFGGEEFCMLMPETTAAEAFARIEGLRRTVAATKFSAATSVEPIQATMSFGIATLLGEALTSEQLVSRADKALYEAKRKGRNRVHAFGQNNGFPVAAEEKLELSSKAVKPLSSIRPVTPAAGNCSGTYAVARVLPTWRSAKSSGEVDTPLSML